MRPRDRRTAYLSAIKGHGRIFATGMVDVRRGVLDEVLAAWLTKEHLGEVYAVEHPDDAQCLLGAVLEEFKPC